MQVRRVRVEVEADYTSRFETGTVDGDARAWAASVFGDAPAPFRLALKVGWRAVLLLRLPGTSEFLGWQAAGDGGCTTLHAAGPLLDAANRVERVDGRIAWTTVVRYRSPLGRLLWSLAAPLHHLTLPWLLARTARRTAAPR